MNGFVEAWKYSESIQEFAMIVLFYLAMAASLVAVVVLMVNLIARRWLTSRQMGFLWGLVLIRLAMPFAPESVLSFQYLFIQSEVEVQETIVARDAYAAVGSLNLEKDQWPDGEIITKPAEATVPEVGMFESLSHSLFSLIEVSAIGIVEFQYSPLIWLTVSMLILFRMLITHWRFTRQVKQTPVSEDDRLLSLWSSCCKQAGVRRQIPLVLFDHVSQPSIMGAIRPRLLLPSDVAELNDKQLKLIMLHELAHVRRRDVAINWGLFSLRLLHWWNPIYWLAASRYCSLREQTCDAMVLRWMSSPSNEKERQDYYKQYSELLLTLAQRPDVPSRWQVRLPVSILGLFSKSFRKRKISNRLHALRRSTFKRHPVNTFIAMATILLIAACGLTNAIEPVIINDYSENNDGRWLPESVVTTYSSISNFDYTQEFMPIVYSVADLVTPVPEVVGAKTDVVEIYHPPTTSMDTLVQDIEQIFILMLPSSCLEDKLLEKYQIKKTSEEFPSGNAKQAKIRFNRETLSIVIRAPQSIHDEISQRLRTYRKSGQSLITVNSRFIETGLNIAELVGVQWNNLEGVPALTSSSKFNQTESINESVARALNVTVDYSPVQSILLTKKQTEKFVYVAQAHERTNIGEAPRVTLYSGQEAKVQNLVNRPFVTGVRWEGAELKPNINFFNDGSEVTLRPSFEEDLSLIRLHVKYRRHFIEDIQSFTSNVKGEKVTIQVPKITTRTIQATYKMKDSQTLLIDCCPVGKEKRRVYLLLTVSKVKEETELLNRN